jgi:leucine dehydrogenase
MSVYEHCEFDGHEHVAFFRDEASGLKAIIAVHNTNLGPALGGCRMWPYANSEEALTDVLRLSKGMTYKAAMANIALGGGKAVIIGNPRADKSEALLEAMGQFINSFQGTYFTAEDSGIAVEDVHTMARHSSFIAGTQAKYHFNGELADGNPAPATAYGVFVGLRTAVKYALNSDLNGVKVAIQGMGHVGTRLGRHLKEAGAELYVADIYSQNAEHAAEELGATLVSTREILGLDVDVLAPCAMGAVINDDSLPHIKAKVIAGAANNQLATEAHGMVCQQKGIVYAPDYVINAGGIIDIYHQRMSSSHEQLRRHIESIGDTLLEIFERGKETKAPNNSVANLIAQERFSK